MSPRGRVFLYLFIIIKFLLLVNYYNLRRLDLNTGSPCKGKQTISRGREC